MDSFKEGFAIVWIGLLAAPLLALILARLRRFGARILMIAASTFLLSYFVFAYSSLAFVAPKGNLACFVVAYFAYCILAATCLRIPRKIIRFPIFVIAIVPIAFGYLLSTVGILGLMFIVGEYTNLPDRTEVMTAGLTCRVTGWGMAAGASGYTIGLYQSWNAVPFLERKVIGSSVTQAGYSGPPPADVTCADLFGQYEKLAAG
jgi:hypothetical protein